MLHMATRAVTSGGRSDRFMVAVTDPDEQMAIIGDKYGVATSEGTVTVLVLGERLLRTSCAPMTAMPSPPTGAMTLASSPAILNIAAIALGYGTHMFMTPALPGPNGFNNGDHGLDVAKYIKDTTYLLGNRNESFSTENMKFVCAVVIGTLDETVETGLTTKPYPDNWIIWDAGK